MKHQVMWKKAIVAIIVNVFRKIISVLELKYCQINKGCPTDLCMFILLKMVLFNHNSWNLRVCLSTVILKAFCFIYFHVFILDEAGATLGKVQIPC